MFNSFSGEHIHNNDSTSDQFALDFLNDDMNNFSDNFRGVDGDLDDYSTNQTYEMYQKTEISHGLLVSTRQVSNTFFHQIVPSQTIKVQLNPGMTTHETRSSKRIVFDKTRTSMGSNSLETTNQVVKLVSLLIICCMYLGDRSAIEGDDGDGKYMKMNKEELVKEKWSISNVVMEKVIWPCVTLAFAFSTIWVHQNYLPNFS